MKRLLSVILVLALLAVTGISAFAEEEKIVIRVANYSDNDNRDVADENAIGLAAIRVALRKAGFFEKHPNVEIENYFVAESGSYNQKMTMMALTGSQDFDAVWISGTDASVLASSGVLMNLDEYYANDTRFDISDDSKWVTGAVDQLVNYQGSRYAFPLQTDCRIAFYYKPICESLGYGPDNYPKTVDEFITFCQKCAEAGYIPWGIRNAEEWTILYEWALPLFGDGSTVDRFDEETGKWMANLDNEAGRRWVNTVRELCKTFQGDTIASMGWNEIAAGANSGLIASHWIGTWFWNSMIANEDGSINAEKSSQYDCTLIPAGTVKSASSMGGNTLGINKNASKEKADLVWEIFATLGSDPEIYSIASETMPLMREAYQYSEFASLDCTKEGWELFQKQLETAQPICTPGDEASANIYNSMWSVWQECTLTDDYSVEEATLMLNDCIQTALNDFYGY